MHTAMTVLLAALAVPITAVPTVARAQRAGGARSAPDTSAGISGTVVDTAGNGLANVDVLVGKEVRARTSAGGGFWLTGLTPGFHLVRFRRFGLKPVTSGVMLPDSAVTDVDAVLAVLPQILATVVVQDKRGEVIEGPADFLRRAQTGMGHYITRAQIEQRHPFQTTDVLSEVPGLVLMRNKYGDIVGVANMRGPNTFVGSAMDAPPVVSATGSSASPMTTDASASSGTSSQAGCSSGMSVYVDGVYTPSANLTVLNSISPGDIVGIEVYRSASEIPAGLSVLAPLCGAVLIWTR